MGWTRFSVLSVRVDLIRYPIEAHVPGEAPHERAAAPKTMAPGPVSIPTAAPATPPSFIPPHAIAQPPTCRMPAAAIGALLSRLVFALYQRFNPAEAEEPVPSVDTREWPRRTRHATLHWAKRHHPKPRARGACRSQPSDATCLMPPQAHGTYALATGDEGRAGRWVASLPPAGIHPAGSPAERRASLGRARVSSPQPTWTAPLVAVAIHPTCPDSARIVVVRLQE
jgi:hypothetical protein